MSAVRVLPLLGVAFLIFGALWLAGGGSVASGVIKPISGGKYAVVCDVTVNNQLGKQPDISSLNCQRESACLFSIASPQFQFLIPKDVVFVQSVADDGAKSGSVKIEITEQTFSSTEKIVELRHCTTSSVGQIKLMDKNSQLLQTRAWVVS